MTLTASLCNKTRKRPYDGHNDDQSVKINRILAEEKPLDLSFKKKNKKSMNNFKASSHHTNPLFLSTSNYSYSLNEEFLDRISISFDNLLFDSLRLLNSIYIISGAKPISLKKCYELKVVGKIKNQIEKYIEDFEKYDKILIYRNSQINFIFEQYFQNKRIGISDWNIENYVDIVYMDLCNDLKNESIPSLINSLLIAVKDFGPDRFFGFISLVLFMFSPDINNQKSEFKEFLVYSIVFFRCLILEECRKNKDIRFIYSWELKRKLYKMILKCFFPSSYKTEYEKIFDLLYNIYNKKKWFNEPQVFLLLYFSNINNIPEFFYIFRNLNNAENTTDKMMIDLYNEFNDYMNILYRIERTLMENIIISKY